MKKKTTWAASVVKKQLQTCCKHQTFSLETTERDDTSQGFGSPSRVIHISSPIKESSNPILLRRKSFNVSHARSLLTTPEPLTPFRKSVESAVPLCRSSTFKSARLQNVKSSPDLQAASTSQEELTPMVQSKSAKGKVLHKSGPLPVLQQLFRGSLHGGISSPLNVKKQLSGPLLSVPRKPLSGSPSPKQPLLPTPSPQRLSKVKFSPTPHEIACNGKLEDMIAEETDSPPEVNIHINVNDVKAKKQLAPLLDKVGSRESDRDSKAEYHHPIASSPDVKPVAMRSTPTKAAAIQLERLGKNDSPQRGSNSDVKEQIDINTERRSVAVDCSTEEEDHCKIRFSAAAVKIQAAYRGYRARNKANSEPRRSFCGETEEAPSISTQMSRTDPQKQRRCNPPPRVNRGWNGSIRSAQDHQALLRSRQEAALKRERAMEYALSRQRWRSSTRPGLKGPGIWCTDDRVPDKPGWVRNWLDRAARMSVQNSQVHRVLDNRDDFFDRQNDDPQSESLSMKSTVGICTTDIGSAEVNLGWPLSLRQQHAAGLLQAKSPSPPLQIISSPTPPAPQQRKKSRSKHDNHLTKSEENFSSNALTSSSTSDESPPNGDDAHEIHESSGCHPGCDLESVGSCDGPVPTPHNKLLVSPVAAAVTTKPRHQQQRQKTSNSNSLKEAAKRDDHRLCGALRPQSQISVALSDGNSADTTAASVQRPLWR